MPNPQGRFFFASFIGASNRCLLAETHVRTRWCVVLLMMILLGSAAWTQSPDRVPSAIDSGQSVALNGSVPPRVRTSVDEGSVDPEFKLSNIKMSFKSTPEQQAALDQLLASQQDPSSANYHQWLTPEEFGDRFGLNKSDIARISGWLESEGFSIIEVARSQNWIAFSGTAGQVQHTFHTQIHHVTRGGEEFFANVTDASIPKALEGVVSGFLGLDNFKAKPALVKPKARPAYSDPFGNYYLAPDDIATIYNLTPLYNAGIDGTGMKIAIMGQTDVHMSDIENFRSGFGLAKNDPTVVLATGCKDPGYQKDDEGEADLDLEWSGAVARNASIILVNCDNNDGGVIESLIYAINNNVAPVMSMSYGNCEADLPAQFEPQYEALIQQGNAQGQTLMVSTGDSGAATCDDGSTTGVAVKGLSINGFASPSEVTAVGGTEFNGDVNNAGRYWQGSNSPTGSSAISYIPELAWNDTSAGTDLADGTLSGTGGGASIDFKKPAFQTGPGVPNDGARDIPDVSMPASPNHDGYIYCTNTAGTMGYTGSCANGIDVAVADNSIVGGTSVSSPVFAGIVALLNQSLGNTPPAGLGNINPALYAYAQSMPSAFHDVPAGNYAEQPNNPSSNIVPCKVGTTNCSTGSMGYLTTTNFDLATGLGSVDGDVFVTHWPGTSTGLAFQQVPGSLTQISAGSGSSIWGINSAGDIYWFNPQTQTWNQIAGQLDQIAVASDGAVWGLNSAQQIYRFNPQTQAWDQIPGSLKQIAVGSAGTVWGINSAQQIYRFDPGTQGWDHIPGALTQIAVSADGAVWGINSAQEIYTFDPQSQDWNQIPGFLTQIAAGSAGTVWGINSAQQIYRFDPSTQGWDHVPGELTQIVVGANGSVWGINSAQEIYTFNPQTQDWDQIPGALTELSVGVDGSVWGINGQQQIFELTVHPSRTRTWVQVPGQLTQVSAGVDGTVWGINSAQEIYIFNSQTQNWDQISGLLSQIGVGFGGAVWGINSAQEIYTFNPQIQNWDQVPGFLKQIAVGSAGTVWGINSAQQIYRFDPGTQGWDHISGALTQIAVSADGAVWGINSAQEIYTFNPQIQNWDQIPGSLTQIAVGSANEVWGINAAGDIYRYDSSAQGWDHIPGQLTQIAVAYDGAVWGINSTQDIYMFNSQTQNWDQIPGFLAQIAVGADGVVWGINSDHQIFRVQ